MRPPDRTSRLVSSANSLNPTSITDRPANLFNVVGYCAAVTARYIKFYDKASAPVVGTDVPKLSLYIPPTTAFVIDFPTSLTFNQGIAFGITTLGHDEDDTVVSLGDILGLNILYSGG